MINIKCPYDTLWLMYHTGRFEIIMNYQMKPARNAATEAQSATTMSGISK